MNGRGVSTWHTGTGTENGTAKQWSLSRTNVNISTWHYTFYLVPVPVPDPFPRSVNVPQDGMN